MRPLAIVCVLLAGCHSGVRPGIAPTSAPYVSSSAERRSLVLDVHDSAAAALQLPALHAITLPRGFREVRLSGGHGMAGGWEYPLLRLVAGPGGVHGEVIAFMTVRDTIAGAPQNHWRARVKRFGHAPDWRVVLQRLDGWGIADLAPPRYTTSIMDAGDLLAEARTGAEY